MSGEDLVIKLIAEQRRRLIATILGTVESAPAWGRMTPAERQAIKSRITDAVNIFYDFSRDVIKVTHEDTVRNEHALELIAQVHESQRRIERQVAPKAA